MPPMDFGAFIPAALASLLPRPSASDPRRRDNRRFVHDHRRAFAQGQRGTHSHHTLPPTAAPSRFPPSSSGSFRDRCSPPPRQAWQPKTTIMLRAGPSYSETSLSRSSFSGGNSSSSSLGHGSRSGSASSSGLSTHPRIAISLGISPLRLLTHLFLATILPVPTLIGGIHPTSASAFRLVLPLAYPLAFALGFGIPLVAIERRNWRVFADFVYVLSYVQLAMIAVAVARVCMGAYAGVGQVLWMVVCGKGMAVGVDGLVKVRDEIGNKWAGAGGLGLEARLQRWN